MAESTGSIAMVDRVLTGCGAAARGLLIIDRRYGDSWYLDLDAAASRLDRTYAHAAVAGSSEVLQLVEILRVG